MPEQNSNEEELLLYSITSHHDDPKNCFEEQVVQLAMVCMDLDTQEAELAQAVNEFANHHYLVPKLGNALVYTPNCDFSCITPGDNSQQTGLLSYKETAVGNVP